MGNVGEEDTRAEKSDSVFPLQICAHFASNKGRGKSGEKLKSVGSKVEREEA